MTEEIVASAIVDPSVQHLEAVDIFLQSHETTRANVLKNVMKRFNIEELPAPEPQEIECKASVRMTPIKKHTYQSQNNSIELELIRFTNIHNYEDDVFEVLARRREALSFHCGYCLSLTL